MTIAIGPALEKHIPFILKGNEVIDQMTTYKSKRGLTAEHLREDVFGESPVAYVDIVSAEQDTPGVIEPVAFVLYSFFYIASAGQGIWVSKVYIDPFSRKRNIGPSLRDHLLNKYPHVAGLYGSVATNNKNARLFFASLGGENLNRDFVYYVVKNA